MEHRFLSKFLGEIDDNSSFDITLKNKEKVKIWHFFGSCKEL